MMRYKKEIQEMLQKRTSYINNYKDIAKYFAEVWKENNWNEYVLFEYEQYFQLDNVVKETLDPKYQMEIIGYFDKLIEVEQEEEWTSLMQAYSDLDFYGIAEKIMTRIQELRNSKKIIEVNEALITTEENDKQEQIICDNSILELFENLFVGREDMYAREKLLEDHKRKSEFIAEPLTKKVIKEHLKGNETIGTYFVRNNDTVKYLVIDIDISQKVLLNASEQQFENQLLNAAKVTAKVQQTLSSIGLKSYIEFSG